MSIATRFVSSTARARLDLSGCVLYAPLWRPDLGGSTFTSIGDGGIPTHICTVTGATWGIQGRTFDGIDDRIVASNDSALNFTSGDFEFGLWLNIPTDATKDRTIFSRGVDITDGYFFYLDGGGNKQFYTVQAGVQQATVENTTPVYDTFEFWSIKRVGSSVKLYKNAVECTYSTVGTHTDPLTSTRSLTLACKNSASPANFLKCSIGEINSYNRILTNGERSQISNSTKWRFQ